MKSNTRIEKQLKKKTNFHLFETIVAAKKNKAWQGVASALSTPRRIRLSVNLDKLNGKEDVVVPGKVLSQGEFNSKNKVIALSFSEKAEEKILKSGGKVSSILEEIKSNPEAKGVKIFK